VACGLTSGRQGEATGRGAGGRGAGGRGAGGRTAGARVAGAPSCERAGLPKPSRRSRAAEAEPPKPSRRSRAAEAEPPKPSRRSRAAEAEPPKPSCQRRAAGAELPAPSRRVCQAVRVPEPCACPSRARARAARAPEPRACAEPRVCRAARVPSRRVCRAGACAEPARVPSGACARAGACAMGRERAVNLPWGPRGRTDHLRTTQRRTASLRSCQRARGRAARFVACCWSQRRATSSRCRRMAPTASPARTSLGNSPNGFALPRVGSRVCAPGRAT